MKTSEKIFLAIRTGLFAAVIITSSGCGLFHKKCQTCPKLSRVSCNTAVCALDEKEKPVLK